MEFWKKIDDYENYSVSTLGRVRNDERGGRIMKGTQNSGGYLHVGLSKNGVSKIHKIHRLVALAFIPNPDNKPCVDHIFNVVTDNRIESLRWATKEENSRNAQVRTDNTSGTKGVSWHVSSQKWQAMISIDKIQIHIGLFDSKEEAVAARQTRANAAFGVFTNVCESYQNSSANANASSPCDLVANE